MTTTHPPTPLDDPGIDGLLHFLRQYVERARAHEAKALEREDAYAIVDAEHASKEATLAEGWIARLETAVARRSLEGAERAVAGELTAFDVRPDESPHAVRLTVDVPAAACFAVRFLLGETLTLSALSSPTREPTP